MLCWSSGFWSSATRRVDPSRMSYFRILRGPSAGCQSYVQVERRRLCNLNQWTCRYLSQCQLWRIDRPVYGETSQRWCKNVALSGAWGSSKAGRQCTLHVLPVNKSSIRRSKYCRRPIPHRASLSTKSYAAFKSMKAACSGRLNARCTSDKSRNAKMASVIERPDVNPYCSGLLLLRNTGSILRKKYVAQVKWKSDDRRCAHFAGLCPCITRRLSLLSTC